LKRGQVPPPGHHHETTSPDRLRKARTDCEKQALSRGGGRNIEYCCGCGGQEALLAVDLSSSAASTKRGKMHGKDAAFVVTWLMMSSMSLGSTPVSSTNSSVSMSAPVDTAGMDVDAEEAAAVAFRGVEGKGWGGGSPTKRFAQENNGSGREGDEGKGTGNEWHTRFGFTDRGNDGHGAVQWAAEKTHDQTNEPEKAMPYGWALRRTACLPLDIMAARTRKSM